MTKDAFVSLVGELGALARKRPRLYRFRAMLLTLGGYAYLWLVVSLLLGVCAAAAFFQWKHGYSHVASKLALAGLALVVPTLRALAKPMRPPEGHAASRAEVPLLFKDLDELSQSLGAPRVHRVFLDTQFNASVQQYPRLGVLGWSLNCLHVGVPLLMALDPTQMRAVLAHELGHLASRHGKLGAWIYRTNSAWSHLLDHLERQKRWGTGLFTRFSWYAPYFDAFTFVLRREQEYEADQCAAQATTAPLMARTLISLELRQRLLDERFWPDVTGHFGQNPDPPEDVYKQMKTFAGEALPNDESREWLQNALATVTAYNDSHPSLADRLNALGYKVGEGNGAGEQMPPLGRSAAQQYLGDRLASVLEGFGHDWALDIRDKWQERHASFQADRAKLAELARRAQTGSFSDEDAWQQAKLTESVEGPEVALPLRSLVRRSPGHASANFALGRLLLLMGDHAGLQHLERVLEVDPDAAPACSRLACPHLAATGQTAKAESYRHLAEEAEERHARVEAEINDVTNTQTYRPHDLSATDLAGLRSQLEVYPDLAAVYLVRRDLPSSPHAPHFVVGLVPRRTLGLWTNWVEAVALRDRVCAAVEFPDDAKVILPRPVFRNAFEAMRRLSGTVVLER